MTRMKKGERTRAKIFRTAIKLFREKGYNDVSVDEIAANAEIAKGTFYIYFPSKAHVVAELFEEYDYRYESASKVISSLKTNEEQLMAIICESLQVTVDVIGCDLTKIAYQSQLCLNTKSTDIERPLYKILTQIITRGQKNGEFNQKESADFYAMLIVRNIRGTIYEWCMTNERFDIVAEGYSYMTCVVRLLK